MGGPLLSAMVDLLIRLKRAPDGSTALTCVRADGTATWQRQRGSVGAVFPAHDLTHYAVETVLGYRRGFYGLLADGWEIADFAPPWPRGQVPPEAREAELVVGVFDMERLMGAEWNADELREQGARYAASGRAGRTGSMLPPLSDAAIARIRVVRAELIARWAAIAPGQSLELPFIRPAGAI